MLKLGWIPISNKLSFFKDSIILLSCVAKKIAEVLLSLQISAQYLTAKSGAQSISKVKKFIFASSSSIYGEKNTLPFNETLSDQDNPIQLYAATKRSNEIIARSYFNLFKMNIIGLRFFTVYGNFGRPDMAIFKFTKNIISEKKIEVYNYGRHFRDFTHIEDVKNAVFKIFKKSKNLSNGRYEIINVGSGRPVNLNTIIQILEKSIGKKAKIKYIKKQIGDVKGTFSDIKKLKKKFGFSQQISIKEGLENFVSWYKQNYKI